MSKNYPEYRTHLIDLSKQLATKIPNTMSAYSQLHKNALTPGALDTKQKELIALGIAIAARCEGCIAFHTQAALKAGASAEQIHETIGVAVMMGGGPSVIYGCEALEALSQFQG